MDPGDADRGLHGTLSQGTVLVRARDGNLHVLRLFLQHSLITMQLQKVNQTLSLSLQKSASGQPRTGVEICLENAKTAA